MVLSPPENCPVVKALIRIVPSELLKELYADAKRRELQEKELQRLQEEKKFLLQKQERQQQQQQQQLQQQQLLQQQQQPQKSRRRRRL